MSKTSAKMKITLDGQALHFDQLERGCGRNKSLHNRVIHLLCSFVNDDPQLDNEEEDAKRVELEQTGQAIDPKETYLCHVE